MRVKTETINLEPVPRVDEYVATVKSRRSASIQPQVDGALTRIVVKSGDHVNAGQPLMTIDPLKQQSVVEQQRSTEAQKKATYEYNQIEVERQRKLYEEGVTSKQSLDLAVQAFENSKGGLGVRVGCARRGAAAACLLQHHGALLRRRGRYSRTCGRLRFTADSADHRG